MTRQHFEAIAAALYETRPDSQGQLPSARTFRIHQWGKDVKRIADVLAQSNSGFKRERFYDACGFDAEYGRD
jgi:hypothetical protein